MTVSSLGDETIQELNDHFDEATAEDDAFEDLDFTFFKMPIDSASEGELVEAGVESSLAMDSIWSLIVIAMILE